jgi:ribonuclease BN (tRNA processing enzyme)
MKVTILGSGTNYVNPHRAASCIMLEHAGGRWLLDMGTYAARRLDERGLSLLDVDRLFISHHHADHIGDLLPGLLSMTLAGIYWPERTRDRPIYLYGYPGLARDYETLSEMYYPDHPEQYEIALHEFAEGGGELELDGLRIRTAPMPHMERFMKSLAFRVEDGGRSLVYSGDTGASGELAKLARGADVLVAEAAFGAADFERAGPRYGHMAPQEAGQTAARAEVEHLVLTHIYDGYEDPKAVVAAAREHFDGRITLAHDGLVLEI